MSFFYESSIWRVSFPKKATAITPITILIQNMINMKEMEYPAETSDPTKSGPSIPPTLPIAAAMPDPVPLITADIVQDYRHIMLPMHLG